MNAAGLTGEQLADRRLRMMMQHGDGLSLAERDAVNEAIRRVKQHARIMRDVLGPLRDPPTEPEGEAEA